MLHFVDQNCKIQFTFVITIPNMPTTRSQKRVINHDDIIVVAKKQRTVMDLNLHSMRKSIKLHLKMQKMLSKKFY